jgi:DNA-binding response OmpR family regulator
MKAPSRAASTTSRPSGPEPVAPDILPARATPYVYLTEKESTLLEVLSDHAGKPVGNDEILSRLYVEQPADKNTLEVHVHNLRKKMRLRPELRIDTILNLGYMLSFIDLPPLL